ncbi:MAG: isoaspartyl peptidase/L-asparaginase [Chitinophagaceae bacterium]|nr:MAG: isoaspartyl peptidase/L-asparaginase [Chitinophagaceae bacterium]
MAIISLAIHGGAGTILKTDMTDEKESAYRMGLQAALDAGYAVLEKGGEAIDAVVAAVVELENNILFNAGRGSVFASDGGHEMDASLMQGRDLAAGAVSAVKNIRNPILLAKQVMTASEHVMLSGKGANDFAAAQGFDKEPDEYFYSAFRHEQWKAVQGSDKTMLDHNPLVKDKKFGTVGAVACDANGHIAAATSTGGMTNKQYGRVGDSPIIGAGTYANDGTCAISCTGHGELFIRAVAAYDVSCLMEYKGLSLREAMDIVVHDRLVKIKGEGGMIGVDAKGNAALLFNSDGMYRGLKTSAGADFTAIYKDEY